MTTEHEIDRVYRGRLFTAGEIDLIRQLMAANPQLNRAQLSRIVCEKIGWRRYDGQLKEMACRVAMLRMHHDAIITMPPPLGRNGNGHIRPAHTQASDPALTVCAPVQQLGVITLNPVKNATDSRLWNELVDRHHYLRYTPGAQLRYLIYADDKLIALLGFAAAAWKAAPRDTFIGWTGELRRKNLHLIVNNSRFLILPWVHSHNLASRLLAMAARQLPLDWRNRYGYQPVLLETFVEKDRFRGTCYRAANWTHVGQTKGRGKHDCKHLNALPAKDIYLYPMQHNFRALLCDDQSA